MGLGMSLAGARRKHYRKDLLKSPGKKIIQVLAKDVNLIFRTAANSTPCLGPQEHPNRLAPYATACEPYVNVSKLLPNQLCRKRCWSAKGVLQFNGSVAVTIEGCICKVTTVLQSKSLKIRALSCQMLYFNPWPLILPIPTAYLNSKNCFTDLLPIPTCCSTTY